MKLLVMKFSPVSPNPLKSKYFLTVQFKIIIAVCVTLNKRENILYPYRLYNVILHILIFRLLNIGQRDKVF